MPPIAIENEQNQTITNSYKVGGGGNLTSDGVSEEVLFVVLIIQWLSTLITDIQVHRNVEDFSAEMAYVRQCGVASLGV